MNGREHYAEAERHLGWAAGDPVPASSAWHQRQAQAHATLALAAAVALRGRDSDDGEKPVTS